MTTVGALEARSDRPAAAVEAVGLSQRFGDRTIFRNVSFSVARGEVFTILGGSGCGKSTLLRQLIGLLPPSAGEARILGHDIGREPDAVRARIGVLFQSGALFGSLTLLDNVMLPLRSLTTLPPAACAAIARAKLAQVGLAQAEAALPGEISGGMAKRAGIARALALDPPLLFLDEPSAGLDPVISAEIDRLVLRLRETLGTTFVVVSHELASILAIADRCIMLDAGAAGIVAEGDPRVLARDSPNPLVRRFFRREAA